MRILFLLLLLICISCKKTNSEQNTSYTDSSKITKSIFQAMVVPAADTVPPVNAVNAKAHGAIGNGVADDTRALQNLIDAYNNIILPAGVYVINSTLNMRSGVTIYGTNSATIKAGTSKTGTLLTFGRYFFLLNVHNCGLINMVFQPSVNAFHLGDWANACIYISNSQNNTVDFNKFQFKQPFASIGIEAAWITGSLSFNNRISNNNITSMGIEYAENGAKNTSVYNNIIMNSHSDALSAHGNGPTPCSANIVYKNVITNAGHMGIEDWGNVYGSVIRGNIITGTGKSPTEYADGIGISAVGVNEHVVSNNIRDAKLYYIETGGNLNTKIDSNIITDTGGKAIGIILNYSSSLARATSSAADDISNNLIIHCNTAISLYGNNNSWASIKNNTVTNPVFKGVDIDSGAPRYTISISANSITMSEPAVHPRFAISSFMRGTNSINQQLSVTHNTISYLTSANKGAAPEISFCLGTNNAIYKYNNILGNNITAAGQNVWAITSNGFNISNINLTGNTVKGANVDLTHLPHLVESDNNF